MKLAQKKPAQAGEKPALRQRVEGTILSAKTRFFAASGCYNQIDAPSFTVVLCSFIQVGRLRAAACRSLVKLLLGI